MADLIYRQQAIYDEQKLINKEQAIDKIKKRLFETALNNVGIKQNIDETLVDVAEDRLENWFDELPSIQLKQNARIFQEIIVEYPSISTYPEYEGKPYFSIKYTEDGQEFIGYGTYKPDVLSEYLKKYFMPSTQPERKKPVFKTGESVYHVSYADGTGGFEKNKWADWTCPDCGWFVGEQYIPRRRNQQKCNYCAKCGCAIDWSDADMRGDKHETD